MIFTINLDVTSIDNTDGNVAFTCKRFYALVLIRELDTGTNETYIPVRKTNNQDMAALHV